MPAQYDDDMRRRLIELAEESIRYGVAHGRKPHVDLSSLGDWAAVPRATFVTVYLDGRLNGCIGMLAARRAVVEDIVSNAYGAAFEDPRFRPITEDDLPDVSVHIAILGELSPIDVHSDAELIEEMRPGIDGVVLDDGRRRGTFLPAVWEKLPDRVAFLNHLKLKAGMAPGEWPSGLAVYRFEVEEFDRDALAETH